MQRDTKIIQTPVEKHEVVLNAYITGRERRALTNVYLQGGLNFDFEGQNVKGLDAKLADKAQDLAWKTVIVSIDGHKDGDIVNGQPYSIVDAVLDMRDQDHQFVVKAVNEVTADAKFEQKKTQ